MTERLKTRRLDLIAANADLMKADLEIPSRLGALLDASVPASWPPGEYDRAAQEFFLSLLEKEGPDQVGWLGWYALLRAGGSTAATLVGACGYFGPPTPQGLVELGYSVCPEFRNQGYATEMTEALVARARSHASVIQISARTQSSNLASVKVLKKTGFCEVGPGPEPKSIRFLWRPSA